MTEVKKIAEQIEASVRAIFEHEAETQGLSDHSQWNWASELGHPCDRFLYYARVNWKERKPKSSELMARLREGREQEDKAIRVLEEAGYRMKLEQLPLQWEKFKIRGRIDGVIFNNGSQFPTEIKSINPWYWDQVKTLEDIKRHSKFWIKKIPGQLNLYLLMKEEPAGMLVLCTFGKIPRIIPMELDYELGESYLLQAERVNQAVEKGIPPEKIPYSTDVCSLCDFEHVCKPVDLSKTDSVDIVPDDVLKLKRLLELDQYYREYTKLKQELIGSKQKPGKFYGKNTIIEDIEITSREIEQTYYDVPKDIKAKYKKTRKITRTEINIIG